MTTKAGVRLWTRLVSPEREVESVQTEHGFRRTLESVRDHLEWLLNTRQGDSPACPTYGLPDISTLVAGLPRLESRFCSEIERTIIDHEPRVAWVRVHLVDTDKACKVRRHLTVEVALRSRERDRRLLSADVDLDGIFDFNR